MINLVTFLNPYIVTLNIAMINLVTLKIAMINLVTLNIAITYLVTVINLAHLVTF